jgi:ABC-type nitrate/sulfonate/bicarbonate transport system permease component
MNRGPAHPVPFRGRGFEARPRRWAPWLAFAALLAIWQAGADLGLVSPLALPSPWRVAKALAEVAASGDLARHVGASLSRMGIGWTLGTLAGLAFGLVMGMVSLARAAGLPIVSALFPVPKIALLPLLILWLGIGEPAKVAVILLGVFFPTVIATYSAVDNVPRNLIRMGQSFGLGTGAIVWKIVLPGALPGILAGFRITAAIALILLVAAEMIGPEFGIGAFILLVGNLMQSDKLIAGVAVLSLLGLAIAFLLGRLEAWLLRWR